MSLPSISFIIPTYNRANTLPEAIKSVLEQSMSNWELLVVDDGSTDKTRELINSFQNDNRVRYFFQENRGVSAARNRGIDESKGEYLIFLDSDDKLLPGLTTKLHTIGLEKFDMVFWQVKKIFHDHSEIWKAQKLEKIYREITATFLSGSACYKKSILVELGGFDEKLQFSENYELGMRISQKEDLKYKLLEEIFLIYNVKPFRENSLPSNKITSLKYLLHKHYEVYLKDSYSHSRLLYQLGYLSEKLKNKGDAKEYYKKAWKIKPDYIKPLLRFLHIKGRTLLIS